MSGACGTQRCWRGETSNGQVLDGRMLDGLMLETHGSRFCLDTTVIPGRNGREGLHGSAGPWQSGEGAERLDPEEVSVVTGDVSELLHGRKQGVAPSSHSHQEGLVYGRHWDDVRRKLALAVGVTWCDTGTWGFAVHAAAATKDVCRGLGLRVRVGRAWLRRGRICSVVTRSKQ